MRVIRTTKGDVDESQLARIVGLEDRPSMMAVWVEWRLGDELVRRDAYPLPKETGPQVTTTLGPIPYAALSRTLELSDTDTEIAVAVCWRKDGALVRRDAHVILKQPSVIAEAVAASL